MSRSKEHNEKIGIALRALNRGKTENKVCPRCKQELSRNEFPVRESGYTGSYCRPCLKEKGRERKRNADCTKEVLHRRREVNRKTCFRKKYGITLERREEMFTDQSAQFVKSMRLSLQEKDWI